MLRDVFAACDFLEKQSCFLSAAMIEEHRERRAESFLRRVAVDATGAAVPTHDHAFGRDADDRVARNVDDALQAREFLANAGELFVSAFPGLPDERANGDLADEKSNDDCSESRSKEARGDETEGEHARDDERRKRP